MPIREIATRPYHDQEPGTAGLRRKTAVFQQPHYLENFLQSIFNVEPALRDATLVIGGDGRYHNRKAIRTAIAMATANGVARVIVGQGGFLSTPAASHLIRLRNAAGGFVFTASHNPAGAEGDFGIKYSRAGGGQASTELTEQIFAHSRKLASYRIFEGPEIDIDRRGTVRLGATEIDIIDCVEDYAALMQSLFDFDRIRAWFKHGHRLRFDAMHAVTGPYAKQIFLDRLGAPADSVVNAIPLEDFGGGHPDPNLTYAKELVRAAMAKDAPDLCAASDGDGDRNLILGPRLFISPGDSLAMLAANLKLVPAYRDGLKGLARSMPTTRAVDRVARESGVEFHETPTGWKFFCNLLDAGRLTLCGEESFGTGSDHVREKDGLWAVLAWLNILATSGRSMSELAEAHWQHYGRHYFARHDYEALTQADGDKVMNGLAETLPGLIGQDFDGLAVHAADDFEYHDPVDGSVAMHQGLRIDFGDEARIVLRRSGTGTSGVTLRLYLERLETRPDELLRDTTTKLAPLAAIAERITHIAEYTGRKTPSTIT
ncbi:MAG: alpha-D-glucose phosphate-specific phosphoglucomutase [Nevskiaceae bacterium]|nr:MAG: alpha-D-glucose phosphate-specific phosphoglucomutase [Nevskiaceae bacterium]TBR74022.1 MAG: alpha-D-glucose phosphate-specific phosphoglucomutase [Nevskiaceae bacterium]